MAFPLLLAGAALGALFLHGDQKEHLAAQDRSRHLPTTGPMGREPSEILPSSHHAKLVPGAIVCCEIYEAFIHTGLVIDDNTIVELHGNGLIRAISPQRFLKARSGQHIFIACDSHSTPIIVNASTQRAVNDIFTYHEYDLLKGNCYRHTWRWLCGEDKAIESFEEFNRLLSGFTKQPIYWDRVV